MRFPTDVIWTALAAAGGIAKQLHIYVRTGEFSWPLLIARAVSSGFSGYMVASAMSIVRPEYAMVAAGVGGYIGAEAMDFLYSGVKAYFSRN